MFTKSTIQLLNLFKPSLLPTPRLFFSNSKKLASILQNLSVDIDGKTTNILDSGMIVGQHIDEETKKVSLSINLNKDYRRIKAMLKS